MAAGEMVEKHDVAAPDVRPGQHRRELAYGEAEMPGGRISAARAVKPGPPDVPFTATQLLRLDEALTLSSRDTGIDFLIYLGPLGDGDEDTRHAAEALHQSLGEKAADAVVIAVSPDQRRLEIVTGEESSRRLPDRSCKLAVMSMVAAFKEGDLYGGLLGGLRMLADQAGSGPGH